MATAKPLVAQLRFYNHDNEKNIPSDVNKWINANEDSTERYNLLSSYGAVVKLGIQALPGTKFYLNNNNIQQGIIINHTGVYELDLRNVTTTIGSLYFDPKSLAIVDSIDNASIIVDILYNPGEGTVG